MKIIAMKMPIGVNTTFTPSAASGAPSQPFSANSALNATPATAAQVPRALGFQVPFAERVRKKADIASMAVGIILEAQQAEAILERGQADLVAVGRQSQYNPNIAHHWAHDLGINRRFEDLTPEYGWWLEKRIKTMEGFATSTGAVIRVL